jgi:hypothetical protein
MQAITTTTNTTITNHAKALMTNMLRLLDTVVDKSTIASAERDASSMQKAMIESRMLYFNGPSTLAQVPTSAVQTELRSALAESRLPEHEWVNTKLLSFRLALFAWAKDTPEQRAAADEFHNDADAFWKYVRSLDEEKAQ